jgi:hypothetical protein
VHPSSHGGMGPRKTIQRMRDWFKGNF